MGPYNRHMMTAPTMYVIVGASATTPRHDREYAYTVAPDEREYDLCTCDGIHVAYVGYDADGNEEWDTYDDGIVWSVWCDRWDGDGDYPAETVMWAGFTCGACGTDFGMPMWSSIDGWVDPSDMWETM